ncbi:MAG TPA: GNAT family N-acetyltransferase [Bacteroidia bacterium]|nr:GNAT family N-acetyltransferase [Bacteroidia bacterium]
MDEYVLGSPKEAILNKGGRILFAAHEGTIIGTIALKPAGNGEVELTKMAVDEAYQGLGAGKMLFEAALKAGKDMGARKILLYSNTVLETAISIYRKYGFVEVPLEKGLYERSNIKMELQDNSNG